MSFREWLREQDYWVRMERVESEFPDLEFDLRGVTMKEDEDGETLVPRRDLRRRVLND